MTTNKSLLRKIFLNAIIIILIIIYLAPLYFVLNTSLKTEQNFLLDTMGLTNTLSISNYIEAWNKGNFGNYFFNSILYVTVCTFASIILTVLVAFPLARKHIRHHKLVLTLFLASMFLPDSTIPKFQIFLRLKMYNTHLGYMLWTIGVGGVALFFFISYIRSIPKDFDEAAAIDGCSYFRYVFTIIFPLMKSAIISMGILIAIGVWNDIVGPSIMFSNEKLFPITKGLLNFSTFSGVNWTLTTAAMIIVAAPLLIIYTFTQKYIIQSVVASGIKE